MGTKVGMLAVALALAGPASAQAAWTSTLAGASATMTGGNPSGLIAIGQEGGFLTHSRAAQLDPGFADRFDFDTTQIGSQSILNLPTSSVTLVGGAGADLATVGSFVDGIDASSVAADVTLSGGAQFDELQVANSGDATPRVYSVGGGNVIGGGGGQRSYAAERISVFAGAGDDTFQVAAAAPDPHLRGGAGGDRFALEDGADASIVSGEQGVDTLDYGGYTTAATVGPPTGAGFDATLEGSQQVPPVASAATGTATVSLNPATNQVGVNAAVSGITTNGAGGTGDLTASHIHAGAPGTNGPIVFELGSPGGWVDNGVGGMDLFIPPASFPAESARDLQAGNAYVNVHTVAHPDGELRGRLQLNQANGYEAPATSVVEHMLGAESFVGGQAGDSLTGNFLANSIQGNDGADTLNGLDGNDTLSGGLAADTITGGPDPDAITGGSGDDTINTADGSAETSIDCGPGVDTLNRDPASVDSDAVISGCESVSPATPPPDPGGGGGDGGTGGDGNGGNGGDGGPAPDTDDPETTIGKAPKRRTEKTKAKFTFTADEAGATFECRLDRKPFAPCTSPKTYKKLKPGKHTFQVIATDAAGNADETAAKVRWKVEG